MLFLHNPIQRQAYEANFYKELEDLKIHHNSSPFNTVCYHLFLAVAELINHGANESPPTLLLRIRESGEALNRLEGMKSMLDDRVWSFIPKRLHRQIEFYWDGVGHWQRR